MLIGMGLLGAWVLMSALGALALVAFRRLAGQAGPAEGIDADEDLGHDALHTLYPPPALGVKG